MSAASILRVAMALVLCSSGDAIPGSSRKGGYKGHGKSKKPHIVLVLADDYGWGNFGVHVKGTKSPASQGVYTPNLDELAHGGVILERHYAYKICAPSRCSLQSGRLATHVNFENTGVTFYNPDNPVSGYAGIPPNMTGIATKMKLAGYRTHAIGKWDIGMAVPEQTAIGRGYESWLGYFQHSNGQWQKDGGLSSTGELDNCLDSFRDFFITNSTFRGGVRDKRLLSSECQYSAACTDTPYCECYEEEIFKQKAINLIQEHDTKNKDRPLFLFYSMRLMHTPLDVPQYYVNQIDHIVKKAGGQPFETQNQRLYAAMTVFLDRSVGQVVHALKAKDMWEDTLFVFFADNGGPIYVPGAANNFPLRGGKYGDFEGGIRTNAFLAGGYVPSRLRGTEFHGIISIADWYVTFCGIAGVDPTDFVAAEYNLPPVDGVNQWPAILSGTNARTDPVFLSPQAILHETRVDGRDNAYGKWDDNPKRIFKLLTGKHPYANQRTGKVYPSCTAWCPPPDGGALEAGPLFTDISVFGVEVIWTPNDIPKQDELTWVEDCGTEGCLFDVTADPNEYVDLAKRPAYDQLRARLLIQLDEFNKGLFDPDRGSPSIEACNVGIDNGRFYGPFIDVDGFYSPPESISLAQKVSNKVLKEVLIFLNREEITPFVVEAFQIFLDVARNTCLLIDIKFELCLLNPTCFTKCGNPLDSGGNPTDDAVLTAVEFAIARLCEAHGDSSGGLCDHPDTLVLALAGAFKWN